MFTEKIKGILVDLEALTVFCPSWSAKYARTKSYFGERLVASWLMKQGLIPAKHSPFENSLRKIYGRDFFDVHIVPDGGVYYGDTDGDTAFVCTPKVGTSGYVCHDALSIFNSYAGNTVIDAWKKTERATDIEMVHAYHMAIRNEDIDGEVDFYTEMCEKAMKYIPQGKFCTVSQIKNAINLVLLKTLTRTPIMTKPYKK